MGLTAGPVPARVDAGTKDGLLQLVDHAVASAWSARRACRVLEVNDRRVSHWQQRRDAGLPLEDAPPGPAEALHGLLPWEREAIVALFDEWAEIDRSHRKLAHCRSRLDKVFVSESSVLRVLQAENLILPAAAPRDPGAARPPWPEWVECRPCQVWAHGFSSFVGTRLHAAIGYVTPDDEHEGRGAHIRKARREGMRKARADRIAYRRQHPIKRA